MKTTGKMFLLTALMTFGCSTAPPQAGTTESLKISELPDVRGCDSLGKLSPRANLKVQMVEGIDDLYLLRVGGEARCIDSFRSMLIALDSQGIHITELASSNPMPGTDPAASNPMPGTDPASSNPMPGTDPSSSGGSGKH